MRAVTDLKVSIYCDEYHSEPLHQERVYIEPVYDFRREFGEVVARAKKEVLEKFFKKNKFFTDKKLRIVVKNIYI